MSSPGEEAGETQNEELDELVVASKYQQKAMEVTTPLHRTHFPDEFVFGAATASYQVSTQCDRVCGQFLLWNVELGL
jgi:hypothetical protein